MTERGLIRRLRARLSEGERGFTMIEVAVAMLIFGVLIAAVATSQGAAMNMIRTDRHRSVAANLAAEEMDTIRATSFTELEAGRIETARDIDGVEYTVVRDSSWVIGDAASGPCDAPADAEPRYLRIDVFVSWPVMSGVDPVTSNTVVTPPVGTFEEDAGHVAVRVLDRDGVGAAGVGVSLAGPQSDNQFTTADGCAFFAYLPAGPYTVTLNAAGYVSYQGETAPSQIASVAIGGITSVAFDYDQAATLDITMAGKDLGNPAPAALSLVLANTHLLPNGLKTYAGTGASRQITGLFPFADGYGVWAGTCADARPTDPPVSTQAGAATAVTLGLPEVLVTVMQDDGSGGPLVPVVGAIVDASHAPDASCTSGEAFAIGQTDENGQMDFALPYGSWTVSINGSPSQVVLTPESEPTILEVLQ